MIVISNAEALIKNGANRWNNYISGVIDEELEKNDFEIRIEDTTFTDLEIEGYEFSSITFVNCEFEKCNFVECAWESAKFKACKFNSVLFIGGEAYGLSLNACETSDCKFEGLTMGEGTFESCIFSETDFEDCNWEADEFSKCVFMNCIIIESDFEDCEISVCRFHSCALWKDLFRGCTFDDVSLTGFDLLNPRGGCSARFPVDHDVSERILDEERRPDGSIFSACHFSNADLTAFDFSESNLSMTRFDRCTLSAANFSKCTNVSAGAFFICDMASASLPITVNFDYAVGNIRELSTSLQRMAYFCIAFCVSAILSIGVEVAADKTIKVPPLGWELPANYYASVIGVVILLLQLIMMIRAENIAAAVSKLPSVLPNVTPLPSYLRDTFLADLTWRFSRVGGGETGFASRSYEVLAIVLAFGVVYFEFPLALVFLLRFTWTYSHLGWPTIFGAGFAVVSMLLACWGAVSFVKSLRGQNILGNRKRSFN